MAGKGKGRAARQARKAERQAERGEGSSTKDKGKSVTADDLLVSTRSAYDAGRKLLATWFEWASVITDDTPVSLADLTEGPIDGSAVHNAHPASFLPPYVVDLDSLLSPKTQAPGVRFFASLLIFYVTSSVGVINRTVTKTSAIHFLFRIKTVFFIDKGYKLPREVARALLVFMDSPYMTDLGLTQDRLPKPLYSYELLRTAVLDLVQNASSCRSLNNVISTINIILYLATTGNRIGSQAPSMKNSHYVSLVESDQYLYVHKGEVENNLTIRFNTVNGKNSQSRGIPVVLRMNRDDLTMCPVLWRLVDGHFAGATQHWGKTILELLDPKLFESTSSTYLKFRFAGSTPVFRSEHCTGSETLAMDIVSLGQRLRKVGRRIGVKRLHSHGIRRSKVTRLKWLGCSDDDIQADLRHVFSSTAYVSYTGSVSAVDLTSKITGTSAGFSELTNLIPGTVDTVGTSIGAPLLSPLRPSELQDIYDRDEICQLHDDFKSFRASMLKKYDVATVDKLDQPQKDAVRQRYNAYRLELRRHIYWECRDSENPPSAAKSAAPTAQSLADIAEVDLPPDDFVPQYIDYNVDAMRELETTLDRSSSVGLALTTHALGGITDEQLDTIMETIPEDQDVYENSADDQEDKEEDEAVDKDDVDDDDYEDESEGIVVSSVQATSLPTGLSTHYRSISPFDEALAAQPDASFPQLYDKLVNIPTNPFLQVGHRTSHVTHDNRCVGCGETIALLLPRRVDEGKQMYRKRLCAHTQQCVRDSIVASEGPQFQERQMTRLASVTRSPLSGVRLETPPTPSRVQEWCGKRKSAGPCKECFESPTASAEAKRPLPSSPTARDHICEFHDLPMGQGGVTYPSSAIFFTHTQSYTVDPVEQIKQCRQLVQERLDVDTSIPYGVRSDMVIDGKTADELAAQPRGADQKYRQVVGPCAVTVRDGLCMLCAADDTASWRSRGGPHNENPVALSVHETRCWQRHLDERSPVIYAKKRFKCPDVVCKTHHTTFDTARELLNHAVLTHMIHFTCHPKVHLNRGWLSLAPISKASDHTFSTDADVDSFLELRKARQAETTIRNRKYNKRKREETAKSGAAKRKAAGSEAAEGSKGRDGTKDGAKDGTKDGDKDGDKDGAKDGTKDGAKDGTKDGAKDGDKDGAKDGDME